MPRYIYAKQPKTLAAFAREVGRREWGTVNHSTPVPCPGLDGVVAEVDTYGHGGLVVVARQAVPALEDEALRATVGVTGGWPFYPASWSGRASVVSALGLPPGLHVYVGEEDCAWAHIVAALPQLAPALAARWGADGTGTPRTAESLLAEAHASIARQAAWARQAAG